MAEFWNPTSSHCAGSAPAGPRTWVLTGRKLGIEEAERPGLVDRRVPAGHDGQAALELAGQIAASSPVAVRAA